MTTLKRNARLLMCAARALRGQLRHQSVDGPGELGARQPRPCRRRARMGRPASHLGGARRRRSSWCRRCRACRISSSPRMRLWCSIARCCWPVSATRSASARRRISKRHSASLQARGVVDAVRKLPPDVVLEGAGDCVWDETRKLFWMGYGPRSDAAARHAVADTFGQDVIALELADPRFYHMDTALCRAPGRRGHVSARCLHQGRAVTPSARGSRRSSASRSPARTARRLAANAVCLGNAVVMSGCGAAPARRAFRARLPGGDDAAALVPAQRRLGLLPDAAARPPFGRSGCHTRSRRRGVIGDGLKSNEPAAESVCSSPQAGKGTMWRCPRALFAPRVRHQYAQSALTTAADSV